LYNNFNLRESAYLSKFGYTIKKELLDSELYIKLKTELKAEPLKDDKYFSVNDTFPIYIETKTKMYIPKMYGIKTFGYPKILNSNYVGEDWNKEIEFNGELLERQKIPLNCVIKACKEDGGCILSAQTGLGKTIISLFALFKLKGKAIIIVNKIPLMNQWEKEIKLFLPKAKVEILQGNKIPKGDPDIIIAMLQSLARKEYDVDIFKKIRVLIVDEVHNLGSKVFSQVLFKLASKYTIGLSATPNRSDGCENVFKYHLGEIVYKSNEQRKGLLPIIKCIKIDSEDYKEVSSINRYNGKKQIQFTSMISELINMEKRNLLIINLIKELVKENRKILILSDRRSHLENLSEMFSKEEQVKEDKTSFGLFLGNMKQNVLEKTLKSQVIFASFAAFSEGVSEKDLDTLIMITPKKYIGHLKEKENGKKESFKIEQICGRIFRKEHIDKNPMIIDLFDNFSVYKTQSAGRRAFYKTHFKNGIFENISMNLETKEVKENTETNYDLGVFKIGEELAKLS
jgi:Rad3-related DNA helicase